jgi:predicted dehydrogenase
VEPAFEENAMARLSRRDLLKASAVATGVTVLPARSARAFAANGTLNIAGIGVGGRGGNHVDPAMSENLVAACDAVEGSVQHCLRHVADVSKQQKVERPAPKAFSDYREMLEKMDKEIDAVFVATPDHHHAPASLMAMKRCKHVYCEKPLAHTIAEARRMAEVAKEMKVATQLGNQNRADEGWRFLCEYVWGGAVGAVKEVHVWTDRPGIPSRPWWPQGGPRPQGEDPVPAGLNWDVWLGQAPKRPFLDTYKEGKFKGKHVYQPFVWRGWWDFGTGALGDIGCHALSGIFSALKIESAASVELVKDAGDGTDEMFPSASVIRWDIPARGAMAPCRLFWYDGAMVPDRAVPEIPADKPFPESGSIVVGEKGKLAYSMTHAPRFISGGTGFQPPPKTIPRCESDHFREWVAAAKGGSRAPFSNFADHSGALTEFVLLGNLAIKAGVGKKVEWDGKAMTCKNMPELNRWVRREPRKGWES